MTETQSSVPATRTLDPEAVLDALLVFDDVAKTTLRAQLGPATTVAVFLRHFG